MHTGWVLPEEKPEIGCGSPSVGDGQQHGIPQITANIVGLK